MIAGSDAALEAIDDLGRQGIIVTVEMVTTRGLDQFGTGPGKLRAGRIVFLFAIDALDDRWLDLLEIGLIDSSWLPRLLPEHAARLQQLIDDPNG